MADETGPEVYVVFEGVFALDPAGARTDSGWVTVRTPSGARVDLPVEAVAEWDVDTPLRPDGRLAEAGAPAVRGVPW
jgi:hypothetical protein